MRVVLFHPTLLPPKDYGGVERVVLWLAKGLVELGHETWVAALPGSRLPEGVRHLEVLPERVSAHDLIGRLPAGTDVVHFQAPPEKGAWEKMSCAGVLTVHGNGKPGEVFPRNTVFLSADHARRHGARAYVHNGIDPSEYQFDPRRKGPHYLFLSKTSWKVKNVRGALRAAARAGAPLWVAGGNRPYGARLEAMIRPGMRWIGPVAGERKAELLAAARALVFPVLWPEPFGLVVAEALVSGTPVIAANRGSLPELLPADVGALLPDDLEAWVDALRAPVHPWAPERCRQWALERFHYRKMAESYVEIYRRVGKGEVIHEVAPAAGEGRAST